MKIHIFICLVACLSFLSSCGQYENEQEQVKEADFLETLRIQRRQMLTLGTSGREKIINWENLQEKLVPLHNPMGIGNMTDWEKRFETEPQNLQAYIDSEPIIPSQKRPFIYLGKLGDFSPAQKEIFEWTAIYLHLFYGCEVKVLPSISKDVVPPRGRRIKNGLYQLHTRYILDEIMKPQIPDSAVNYLLLTAEDLYPRSNWNFVFGQASLKNRVGVWSMNRFGNADANLEAFKLCLKRTLKTAAHETGHMFSMRHCTFFSCTMQGAYHLEEADERPMHLCPICLGKRNVLGPMDVEERYENLEKFWSILGFEKESRDYQRFLHVLKP